MKQNEYVDAMPFHWRIWDLEQKLSWCKMAISAIETSKTTAHELASNMNDLLRDEATENIDQTPLHQHAAMIVELSD